MRRESVRASGLAKWTRGLGAGIGSRMVRRLGSKLWIRSWSDFHDWRECPSTGAIEIRCKQGEMLITAVRCIKWMQMLVIDLLMPRVPWEPH